MLTVRGQQHSFSTHEQVFLWKCHRFWDRKWLDLRGTRTPNLRIHAESSNYLSYQGQTFVVPCFWILALVVRAIDIIFFRGLRTASYSVFHSTQTIFVVIYTSRCFVLGLLLSPWPVVGSWVVFHLCAVDLPWVIHMPHIHSIGKDLGGVLVYCNLVSYDFACDLLGLSFRFLSWCSFLLCSCRYPCCFRYGFPFFLNKIVSQVSTSSLFWNGPLLRGRLDHLLSSG